jgi:hypothetical protein
MASTEGRTGFQAAEPISQSSCLLPYMTCDAIMKFEDGCLQEVKTGSNEMTSRVSAHELEPASNDAAVPHEYAG